MEHTNITELAKKWGVSRRFVYNALKAGRIPGAELIDGKWYIPKDAENPIKRLVMPKDGYISAKEAAEKWGAAKTPVCRAAKDGRIPGAEFIGGRWHIPEDAENPLKQVMSPKPGYISTKEAAERWGIKQTALCEAAKGGRIPGAEFIGGRWHIPEAVDGPIDGRKSEDKAGYTTIQKTADRWGISRSRVYQLCQEGRIPDAVYENKRWCVPVDAKKPEGTGPMGTVSAPKKAEEWGVSTYEVTRLCGLGLIPGTVQDGCYWHIPKDAAYPLEGFIPVSEMAERWGMNRVPVSKFCKNGRIPGVKRVGNDWYIPVDAKKPVDRKIERKDGYMSATKTAQKWGVSRNFVCIAAKEGRIPGAELIDGRWHIPEDAERPGRWHMKG